MEKREPIKRSKELVSLSRDHHDGLLLCWKINAGISKGISAGRIGSYVVNFFDDSLAIHFEDEEQYVFSLLEPGNSNRKEAELHHVRLREFVDSFRNSNPITTLSLKSFSDLLNEHIRFEERVLFNIIEQEADSTKLKSVEENLTNHSKCNTEWHDQFWLKENE